MKNFFNIEYYHDYISPQLASELLKQASPVCGVEDLKQINQNQGLETIEALRFLCELYSDLEPSLNVILKQRIKDRKFIDQRVRACYDLNKQLEVDFLDPNYETIIGKKDEMGRIVIGPLSDKYCQPDTTKPVAAIPDYLKGPHVTLFGPPGDKKMAINAMNTYHRKIKNEPQIVEEILSKQTHSPMWGADDEDSKTPLRSDLVSSAENLTSCFKGQIEFEDDKKSYKLANSFLAKPIKRFPGLALPCTFLFYKNNPIPLHLYDFALHLFHHWDQSEALCFYVPKLENEEEAKYIHQMIARAEAKIKSLHPEYVLGSVRLMIVLENPRAILRVHEIMDALYPYFVGASLGWHDYLASMARLFKEEANYRIPVKADPDIVIKYIKASHEMLADVVGSRGGIKVGGMYGILPLENELTSDSFQTTLVGYFKDVITQMRRDLTGFWVAHPDFVRIGLAIVTAWKNYIENNKTQLEKLITNLLVGKYQQDVLSFLNKADVEGLSKTDSQYARSLLVADLKESDFIANNHPDEIRYNVFQSLQYLTDWLCGNGCVALPAIVRGVPVRVMDDLATAERSRWEVWHEIYHGRFSMEEYIKIAFEELQFIRKDLSDSKKIVQVKWNQETARWYPIAFELMILLMTSKNPVEFATELLMPFTVNFVREKQDPLGYLKSTNPQKYKQADYVQKLVTYFEACGCLRFAKEMAGRAFVTDKNLESSILSFSKAEIIEAASFHGDIGQSEKGLDSHAKHEQEKVLKDSDNIRQELLTLGQQYLEKFQMKFLISAKDKSADYLLQQLKLRLQNTEQQELEHAKIALLEITKKRLDSSFKLEDEINKLKEKYKVNEVQLSASSTVWSADKWIKEKLSHKLIKKQDNKEQKITNFSFVDENQNKLFQLASLSKTIASIFSTSYLLKNNISLDVSVNQLLENLGSTFRLADNSEYADFVTVRYLMNHTALNMHYVNGIDLSHQLPKASLFLKGHSEYRYEELKVISQPGKEFHYSGGGFILLEYIIELHSKKSIYDLTEEFFNSYKIKNLTFYQKDLKQYQYVDGFFSDGTMVPNGRMQFPAFAAGALGTAQAMHEFLDLITRAYYDIDHELHDAAIQCLQAVDLGSQDFMGCNIGLGVFVAEADQNKFMIHQGANEGFRCLYIHCFKGPDVGKGFVILCNADENGVLFNAELAQILLQRMNFSGINFSKFQSQFLSENIKKEQIVNLGYKNLIFDAFIPQLPEEILNRKEKFKFSDYNLLSSAQIIKVSDQKFARGENLISEYEPVFDPILFGSQGKIMDSWETVRHNSEEFDFIRFKLEKSESIKYIFISTKYHDGNQVPLVSIHGKKSHDDNWIEILPRFVMNGHSYVYLQLPESIKNIQFIEVRAYPDGGLTRLGLFSEIPENEKHNFELFDPKKPAQSVRYAEIIPQVHKSLGLKKDNHTQKLSVHSKADKNIASSAFGAKLISATNEHYGPAVQVISAFQPLDMFDGLESSRSRKPGHFEEAVIELAETTSIKKIILNFQYFVNNNPKEIEIFGLDKSKNWITLVEKNNVKAYAGNKKSYLVKNSITISQIKIKTIPDGGINRIEVYK